MPILWGIILLLLGLSLAVVWWQALVVALQGLAVVLCVVVGSMLYMIGYSELKARRDYDAGADEAVERAELEEEAAAAAAPAPTNTP